MIARMVDLRRRVDVRLEGRPEGRHWMIWELWLSPEGELFSAIRNVAWLQDGGLPLIEAWSHLCPQDANAIEKAESADEVRSIGIRSILSDVYPDYLSLGREVTEAATVLAERRVSHELNALYGRPPFPPLDWLNAKISHEDFFREVFTDEYLAGGYTRTMRDLIDLPSRIVAGDEIWRFRSPSVMWQSLRGRSGFALVRRNWPIAYAAMVMS